MPVPSTILSTESLATDSDLWSLAFFLEANWKDQVVVRTRWQTSISSPTTGKEQRRGRVGSPCRQVEGTLTANKENTLELMMMLERSARSRHLFPILCDVMVATDISSANISTITTGIRVEENQRVVVWNTEKRLFAVATVTSVSGAGIVIDQVLGLSDFNAKQDEVVVYPLIEAALSISHSAIIKTDSVIEASVTARELPGPWNLSPLATPGSSTTNEYKGYPIYPFKINFEDSLGFKVVRPGSYSPSGISEIFEDRGPVAFGRNLPSVFSSREEALEYLRFFDSRAGRLHPFWVVSSTSDYKYISGGSSTLIVQAVGPEIDWQRRPHIALVKDDGTTIVSTILGVTREISGDKRQDVLTLSVSFGVLNPSKESFRLAMVQLVRYENDELEEVWETDSVLRVDPDVIQIVDDEEITIQGIVSPVSSPMELGFDALSESESVGLLLPMYYEPCGGTAFQQGFTDRPAARAANLDMPNVIDVRIGSDFEKDDNFEVLSGTISNEMMAALPGDYRLEYQGLISGPTNADKSRHWHHIFYNVGSSIWSLNESSTFLKYLWRATKTYEDSSEVERTITVDFVVELENTAAAGQKLGMLGPHMQIFVFCDEVNSSYSDGDQVTNKRNLRFYREDPLVWGKLGSGGLDTERFAHPQCLLAGHIPTTWNTPCDYNLDDDIFSNAGPTSERRNKLLPTESTCQNPSRAIPWLGDPASNYANDITHFHDESDSGSNDFNYRAITLGGDCPESELFDFVCMVNGGEAGITALTPNRTGLDENYELDVQGGSTISIKVCLPPQPAITCCQGNTSAEMSEGGSSISCWRVSDLATSSPGTYVIPRCPTPTDDFPDGGYCCFPITSQIILTVQQQCQEQRTRLGGGTPPFCDTVPCDIVTHHLLGTASKVFVLEPSKIKFAHGRPGGQMIFEWADFIQDPDYIVKSWSDNFDGTDSIPWAAETGQWTFNTGRAITNSGVGGDSTYFNRAARLSDNEEFTGWLHGTAEIDCYSETTTQGIASRGIDLSYLIGCEVDPVAGTISIYRTNGASKLTLVTSSFDEEQLAFPYRLKWSFDGSVYSASIIDSEGNLAIIGASASFELCDLSYVQFGDIFLVAGGNCEFGDFELKDNSATLTKVYVNYIAGDHWTVVVPEQAMPYYGQDACVDQIDSDCCLGFECNCNCSQILRVPYNISETLDNLQISPNGTPTSKAKFTFPATNNQRPVYWPSNGGVNCEEQFIDCDGTDVPCNNPFPPFIAAKIEPTQFCNEPDYQKEENNCDEVTHCRGMNYWIGTCQWNQCQDCNCD